MKNIKVFIYAILLSASVLAQTFIQGPALIQTPALITSAAGTTTLTNASQTNEIVTGITTQSVKLPNATTLPVGRMFYVGNESTGNVTVQYNDASTLQIVYPGTSIAFVLQSNGSTNGVWNVSLGLASTSTNGLLSSTDWNTFNNKQAALTFGNLTDTGTDGLVVTSGTGAVIGSGTSLAQHVADVSHNGYLSATDWGTFNSKQNALTIGDLTDAGTDGITVTGGTGSVIGSGTSFSQHVADSTHNGYLSSSDWSTFNGKGSGTVTAVSVASANGFAGSSSGGSTPALTLSTTITGVLQGNGTAISAASTTGSGSVVLATSPTISNPVVGTQTQGDSSTKAASTAYVDTAVSNAAASYLLVSNNLSDVASKTSSFNNLSPMTTGGDLIYGGTSGTGTRLANGNSGQFLQSNGGTSAPSWVTANVASHYWANISGGTFWTDNCTTDPCTINVQNSSGGNTSWLSAVNRTSTGTYVLHFNGVFSQIPACTFVSLGRAIAFSAIGMDDISAPTSSAYYIGNFSDGTLNTRADGSFSVQCDGI